MKEYIETIMGNKEWLKNLQNNKEGKNTQNKERKEKQIKKKTWRSKKINNALRKFIIVYQNIRGLKLKVDAVQELVDDCQPNLLCLVETHMQEEEEIRTPGMRPYIGMIRHQIVKE